MTTLKSDCRKFAPNIFNKTKCQNCFRTKDSHTAEALESNRATRKIAKCGYLFVAPDWDFTLSVNRTKRWQRRWFILYDDGELTYSVDEHPNTIPQAVIDMNKVVDVADAEDITGNQFSVAITAPEKIHFVKGTSRDESKWWFDVLSRFPKSMVRAKHKRNATFPGGITTTSPVAVDISKTNNGYTNAPIVRPRFHSFNTDNNNQKGIELEWQPLGCAEEDVFPTKETPKNNMGRKSANQTEEIENINNLIKSNIIHKVSINNQDNSFLLDNKQELQKNILDNVKDSIFSKERLKIEDGTELVKNRSRRYLKRESRGIRSQRSRSDGVAKMIPAVKDIDAEWLGQNSRIKNYHHNPVYLLLSDVPTLKRFESLESLQTSEGSPLPRRRHTSEKVESFVKSFEKNDFTEDLIQPELITNKTETTSFDANRNSSTPKNGSHSQQILPKRLSPINVIKSPRENNDLDSRVKGDSEVMEVDTISPTSISSGEIRVDLNSEDLFIKKGWLLRLGTQKEWCKHWFVLKNTTLSYYRDPTAEDSGILDGILDLGLVKDVMEVETDRNFAFSITTWDDKKHIIGSITVGIRTSWMLAICRAISLLDNNNKHTNILPQETQRHNSVSSPPLSSEEADRPADVSSSDDHSEYYSVIDDDELMERCSSPRALPPSPPVNRTAISRVKEKARSRSNSRSRVSRHKLHSPAVSDGEYPTINGENGHESDGAASDQFMRASREKNELATESISSEDVPDGKITRNEVVALEEKCGELEERLKEQEKQIGEKSAELNNLKSLKGSYRDLVEKYNNLKKKLEEKQKSLGEEQEESHYKLKYESLKTKYRREKADRENKSKEHPADTEAYIEELIVALNKTKELLCKLKERIENFNGKKDISSSALKDVVKLCVEVENLLTTGERKSKKELELSKLKTCVSELQTSCNSKQDELDKRMKELGAIQESLNRKKSECRQLQLELQKLKEENAVQMVKLKERHSLSSPNSASDLESLVTSERHRFERALDEIRKLKRELKESQDSYDDIEICYFKLNQEMKDSTDLHSSQMALMTARVDDLTSKLTTSERALRQLKQKATKLEARQERRRSSLKGKEALSLSKEYEGKLVELEQKINVIESTLHPASDELEVAAQSPQQVKRKASQDSTTSESNSMLLRLHSLDSKVKTVTSTVDSMASSNVNPVDKPKICLQIKNTEEGTSMEDAMEHWSSLSVTTSMSDLHTIEPDDQEMPSSLSEYVETLGQKIETMLKWLRSLLLLLAKPETTEAVAADSQLSSLALLLDQLLSCRPEDSICSGIETLVLKTMYDIILLQESAKSAFKLNDFNSYKAKSIQVGILQLECIMQELETKVISATEDHWIQVEDLLKKMTKSEDIFQGSLLGRASLCMPKEQLLKKLNELEQKFEAVSNSIHLFQNKRLQSIQQPSLDNTELPVKDSDQETFSNKIKSTIANVHNHVLFMLSSREEQQLSLLDYDHSIEMNWGCAVRDHLQAGMSSLECKVKDSLLRFYLAVSKDTLEEKYLMSAVHDLAQATAVEAVLRGSIEVLGKRLTETEFENQLSNSWSTFLQQRLHRQASYLATTVLKCPSCVCEECSDQRLIASDSLGTCMTEMVEHYKRVLAEDRMQFNRDLDQLQKAVDSLHHEQERQRQEGCKTCRHLQQQVQRLQGEIENCKVLARSGSICERCKELHRKLEVTLEKHQKELAVAVEKEQIMTKQKMQEILQQKDKIHADETAKLKQEIHVAQKNFKHLQDQFDSQIQSLEKTYEQQLAQKKDYFHQEAVLQRYNADMGDLKGLCEKGLLAMENSHRRVIAEVERKHKQQLDLLHKEKEKALAQETQATLTALEAIRRAHKQELQQELSKLKEEMLQMKLDQESELILKHHESELGDIKREILSLSEKYSVKCFENASLEEKLQALSQQLHESSYQVFDLLARNKQLRVYLSADISHKREFIKSSEKHPTVEHLKKLLDLKEYELVEEKEENAQLRNRLHQAQNQIEMLDIHCQQLDQSLQTKRGLWDSEISGLRRKLEAIIAASSTGVEESISNTSSSMGEKHCQDKFRTSLCIASVHSGELMRSSSSPGLNQMAYLQKAVPLS